MSFIWPAMLLSLLLIPLLVVLYLRTQYRRQRLIANFSNLGFEQNEGGRRRTVHRHIPMVFFLVGLTILLLTLARPQAVVSLPRVEGTVILVFDVSGSMTATDLSPTRMEAAKSAARNFVQSQPVSIQIGVVAFSDSGLSVQVPTNDQAAILAAIDRLTPANGTALANGILASLNTIAAMDAEPAPSYYSNLTPEPTPTPTPLPPGKYTSAVIVMLTDGENNEDPDPMAAAQAAADRARGQRRDGAAGGRTTGRNDQSASTAARMSATISSGCSMPTETRIVFSVMPPARRASSVIEAWLIVSGYSISDSTPPSDSASWNSVVPVSTRSA